MAKGAEEREDMPTPPAHDVWWISSDGRKILARTWFEARLKVGGYGTVHNVHCANPLGGCLEEKEK